jgi:hypothetical protein
MRRATCGISRVASFSLPLESYEKPPATTAKLLNCHIEALPAGAKTPLLLARSDGIRTWATVGTGPVRAMIDALESLFVVSGTKLYEVDSGGTSTELGDVGAVSSIDMARNTDSVVVVNTPNAFYWDGSTFGQITDSDFTSRGASQVEFDSNYLLFLEPNSGRFFGADLGSATSFDALNFATAEATPDELIGMKVDHQQVVLFGTESIEIWQISPIAGFPYEKVQNGFVEIGCFNGNSIAKLDNSLVWLANDYTVRRLDGVTPVRISHHGVEASIRSATISTARAFSYSKGGHLFYVLSFNEVTWVYDATTQKWHERQTYGFDRWTAGCNASVYGYELVGSTENGDIGILDHTVFTEWGDTQRTHWVYQPIYAENRLAFHDRLEIVCKTGVGTTTGQGSDPQLMLEYSDDGGLTWASLPNKSLGPLGQYVKHVEWRGLGCASQRVYRGAVSDPVEIQIVDTIIDVRGGRV